jgi:phospholipase C
MKVRVVASVGLLILLAACGGGSSFAPANTSGGANGGGSSAGNQTPVQSQGGSKIAHVVIVIQENRTFDDMFNGYPGSDTVSEGLDHTGGEVQLVARPMTDPYDPSHTYQSLLQEYDNGKMDGFDLNPVNLTVAGGTGPTPPDYVYGYVPRSETTIYWQLASAYAVADRMFSTEMAPSFPGHLTLIGGQSNRIIGDPEKATNPDVNFVWGCDSPSGSTVDLLSAQNQVESGAGSPCTDMTTLGDMADQKGVTWKYYSGLANGLDLDGSVSVYDAISHIRYGADWPKDVPQTASREFQIFADIANGVLPQISWLTPPSETSDHAGDGTAYGPDWVGQLVEAIENSKLYAGNTTIIVTWDDSGGWYDHVVPPSFNGLNYGLRVPLIVISPYTKQGYVSHVTHNFGSILRFTEDVFDLGCIGVTDCTSDDLSDMFNFSTSRPFTLVLQPQLTLAQIEALMSTQPVDDDK